jgi:thiol:disulfide interchange protein DsbA
MLKKLLFIFLIPSLALAAEFVEGTDYQVVPSIETAASNTNKPSVTEFFSYGCPWCYKIEAPFNAWTSSLGKEVQINKVPVVFKPEWDVYAKAYYTAKTLAMTDKLSPVIFKAVQETKQPLTSNQAMVNLFVAEGVDKEIAKSAMENSPTIETKVKNGMYLMGQYQISAVPAFVINHKYKTDLQMAKSPERLIEIMSYLVRKG